MTADKQPKNTHIFEAQNISRRLTQPRVSLFASIFLLTALLLGCASESPSTPDPASSSGSETESASTQDSSSANESNTQTVELAIASVDDIKASLKSLIGKPVIVDIWSTSCLPCMREYPNLVKLHNELGDKLHCVSVNVDYLGLKSKTPESYQTKVYDFLTKQNSTLKNFLSTTPDSDTLDAFGVNAMPAILLYDAEGNLIKAFTDANAGESGLTYDGIVIPEVQKLLENQPAP